MNLNWNIIRSVNNSQNEGFEEFVCQLARKEDVRNKEKFIRKGKPDGGVECYWKLTNGDEYVWQAKFFTASLNDTQWKQIDKSVKTALETHPSLKKFYIAIPIDPPDARIKGQNSMLQKWEKRVKKWEGWASDKGMNVNYFPWWSSDLIQRLQDPKNQGFTYFWFNKEEFTDKWLVDQTELSIADLGNRYTPEINVELDIVEVFSGLARDEEFRLKTQELVDDLLIKGNKAIPRYDELESESEILKTNLLTLRNLFHSTEFTGIDKIPVDQFKDLLDEFSQLSDKLDDFFQKKELEKKTKSDDYGANKELGSEIHHIREFDNSIYTFRSFLRNVTIQLANNPYLLLDGEAGIGKSHLLADVIQKRNSKGLTSVFFLGQHFVTDEDPWTQIFKKYDIHCKVDEFLSSLNAKAQNSGYRAVIYIDAVNEGHGKIFWANNLNSFILKVKQYEWLGLVLSVRSSYMNVIFPEGIFTSLNISQYTHYGFREFEYEASKVFFENYNIELPSVPMLHPEFQNPLFLKLFCEGLNRKGFARIPDGLQGITTIFDFFVDSINGILSKPDRLNYSRSVNLVRKSISEIVTILFHENLNYLGYERALILINKICAELNINGNLLDELISEGVLSKNLYWIEKGKYEEGVYIAYERFEDHLKTSIILDSFPDLKKSFDVGGELHYLVADESACAMNKGLIESLSIQLPEKRNKEFYEIVPHTKNYYDVVECFVQSLLWRKTNTLSNKLRTFIDSHVIHYRGAVELFFNNVILLTSIPNHFFNAEFLHKRLLKDSMADRDSWWSIMLTDNYQIESACWRIIEWAWNENDRDHISDESIKLMSMTLAWIHTSTNRKLRDSATKALVCLLENRITVLKEVLEKFDGVNDPYVYERLFAVAYGCSLRTEKKEQLPILAEYIFETVFNKDDEIYPHILLRDYARGVIEYTSYLGYDLSFDISLVRPPYKSTFPDYIPSNDEIDQKYKIDHRGNGFEDYQWSQNSIISSMTTEHGRGMLTHYGDFGRYVFQSALHEWEVDPVEMSNVAIGWIIDKYGYDVKKHGKFDRSIRWDGRHAHKQERIGKKYQWIALYEILAKVSDNCIKCAPWACYGDKEFEKYDGSWNPYVRDIDPTMIIKDTEYGNDEMPDCFWWAKEGYSNWEIDNKKWIKLKDDLPNTKNIINVFDENNQEWLVLEGYPEWAEPRGIGDERWESPHKRMWYQIRSYIVPENEYSKLKKWMTNQHFWGRWMPESSDRYEVFSREYFWSPAYNYFNKPYYSGEFEHEICEQDTRKVISKVRLTTNSFLWEEEFDYSKEDTIRFLKPSQHIFENMNLRFSKKEGEFIDDKNNVICFDPRVYNDSKSYLLIKKKEFLEYLKINKLRIVWAVLGEKTIIGGYNTRDEYLGRQEISGAYYFTDKGNVGGKLISKIT